MKDIVIGYGQIGMAVHEAICPKAKVYDIKLKNTKVGRIDYMHICFPYDDKFVNNVQEYMIRFEPKHVVVWSTVDIGTCKKIGAEVLHSPIEGVHPRLSESIKLMTRWIGYNKGYSHEATAFANYLPTSMDKMAIANTTHTETLKLLSTTEYGVNLAFADYKAKVAKSIGMPYHLTQEWNESYNRLYEELKLPQFKKFILYPPEGVLGGHCILPNVEILEKKYNHKILEVIKEVGK